MKTIFQRIATKYVARPQKKFPRAARNSPRPSPTMRLKTLIFRLVRIFKIARLARLFGGRRGGIAVLRKIPQRAFLAKPNRKIQRANANSLQYCRHKKSFL